MMSYPQKLKDNFFIKYIFVESSKSNVKYDHTRPLFY